MIKILFLFLLFYNSLYSQSASNIHSTINQIEYFKSNFGEYCDENGYSILNSNINDSIVFTGESNGNVFGYTVSSAGDVNRDGFSDIIVGAHGYNGLTGRAYIFYGGEFINNIADVTMTGEASNNYFGNTVSSAGDVNNDGYSDVIIGASGYNGGMGKAYIYFGGTNMDNQSDITIVGESINNSYFGNSVSTAGDVNGDGYSDVIVGAPRFYSNTEKEYFYKNGITQNKLFFGGEPGRAYIFYGGNSMNNIADVVMTGIFGDNLGYSVSEADDLNGDGYSDVIVGGSNISFTRAFIFYGGADMNNVPDVIMAGDESTKFGFSVSTAGDVNGDNFSDVIVGAPLSPGKSYVYYGGVNMNNVPDVIMMGEGINNFFGHSVSKAGDLNSDGFSDILVGMFGYNEQTGRVFIYYGGTVMDNIADDTLTGESIDDKFGECISNAGDVNGDGNLDIIVGAYGKNGGTGSAYLFQNLRPKIYINIKLLFEGMYSIAFNQLVRKDSVTAYLHNSTSPFNIVDSSKSRIDSISFTGSFNFFNAPTGTYYISIKHLNSIETWSKSGGKYLTNDGSIYNYDFTTSNTQAFGNNLKLKGSKYCLFSGDVNQDGYITLFDVIPIYNDAINFLSGRYIVTDLNGDGVVDLTDVTLCYNNSTNFVRVKRP